MLFSGNLFQKSKLFVEAEIQNLDEFEYKYSMVICIFLVRKYPFCVNLIQKFKRVILRRNLVPTLKCLIDVSPPAPPLVKFSIFFKPNILFPPPSPRLLIIGESFQPDILMLTFLRSRRRSDPSVLCFFASSFKEVNSVCCFLSQYKEANLLPIIDLISQK